MVLYLNKIPFSQWSVCSKKGFRGIFSWHCLQRYEKSSHLLSYSLYILQKHFIIPCSTPEVELKVTYSWISFKYIKSTHGTLKLKKGSLLCPLLNNACIPQVKDMSSSAWRCERDSEWEYINNNRFYLAYVC